MKYFLLVVLLGLLSSCQPEAGCATDDPEVQTEASVSERLVAYAESLYGVPYLYGSTDPEAGFDCSGFVHHVFTHFEIEVPRSSVYFAEAGTEVPREEAVPGDLVLFTGTDPGNRIVGHIGIVVTNDDEGLDFIHSTSGKQHSVTLTSLEGYYETRFVKVIRII